LLAVASVLGGALVFVVRVRLAPPLFRLAHRAELMLDLLQNNGCVVSLDEPLIVHGP